MARTPCPFAAASVSFRRQDDAPSWKRSALRSPHARLFGAGQGWGGDVRHESREALAERLRAASITLPLTVPTSVHHAPGPPAPPDLNEISVMLAPPHPPAPPCRHGARRRWRYFAARIDRRRVSTACCRLPYVGVARSASISLWHSPPQRSAARASDRDSSDADDAGFSFDLWAQ